MEEYGLEGVKSDLNAIETLPLTADQVCGCTSRILAFVEDLVSRSNLTEAAGVVMDDGQ